VKIEVEQLFHELADLSPEARSNYFAEHEIDAETRREVEALLDFDSGASSFLLRDISIAANSALPQLQGKEWRCGPYRLLDLIGRGGMGAVYLAERADGEVTQRLAVKLLPPGAGDPQRKRFLQERQILASLAHPNIARMLDAGHLESGQPFLAMEYIEGKPIDIFCDGLSVRQKITLFLKVCAAVGYLHRNLIVHRDLKPSNILVTDEGEPKLLDFGIAKFLDVTTDSTATSMRMLTPDYASPEQVTGGRVTTATDIYSLGAVLYKLLTRKPVHEFEDHSPEAIAWVATSREVTRPSKWAPELKGDVECILLKALRKDPHERYATVEQFADDLLASLEFRTVRARSGNAWYRTRKFVRRYWVPVSAAALVIASLGVGLYIANRERLIAERRFQDVRQLANKLFDVDARVAELPGSTRARQLIVDTSLEYLRRLKPNIQGDSELALDLGNAYMRVARVQGVPIAPNLGQMDQAEQSLKIAQGLIESVLVSQPSNRTGILRAAQIAHDRMIVARLSGRPDDALALARKSAELVEKFHAQASDKPEMTAVLNTYLGVADQFRLEEQFDETLRLCRRGTEIARLFDSRSYAGDLLWVSAEAYLFRGELEQALKDIRESVRLLDLGSGDMGQTSIHNLGLALIKEGRILAQDGDISFGRSQEAVRCLERAFEIEDELVHKDPLDQSSRGRLAMAGISLADILRHSDAARALGIYEHTLRHLAEVKNNSSFLLYEVSALAGSSYPLRHLGRPAEARKRLDAAFERLRQLKIAERVEVSEVRTAICALADHEAETSNVPQAIEIYEGLFKQIEAEPEKSLGDAVVVSNIWAPLATLYRRNRQFDLASALEAKRLSLWRHWDQKLPNNVFVLRQIAAASK